MSEKNRRCVFTSAGDRNNVSGWLAGGGQRSFDLVVAYYGNDDDRFRALERVATRGLRAKGSKFQNLWKLHRADPELFASYDHIWVADDDVVVNRDGIDALFAAMAEWDFWVAQPAMSRMGRVTHKVTEVEKGGADARVVNFVEVTCPIFRADKLRDFLEIYDGSLAGWGIDWWLAHHFDARRNHRFAVFDRIDVINPHQADKAGGTREIDRLQPWRQREAEWFALRDRLGLKEYRKRTLARLYRPVTAAR